jgi:hypothetical protein
VLAIRERLLELLALLFLSCLERSGSFPVLTLPRLALRDLRIEGCGETLPFGLESLDLCGELLPCREYTFELLEPFFLSCFELGASAPVLNLPLLTICDLRVEGCGQTLPLDPILVDLCDKLLVFRERLFELLARLFLPSFLAFTADLFALKRSFEPMRQRRVAEAEQQRVDTVRVVVDRNALKEHGSIGAVRESQMVFNRRGAARPGSIGKFLPIAAGGRGQAVRQVGIQDGAERFHAEEAERRIIAGEEQAVPAHANQAARLPLEELTEIRGIRGGRRRARAWRDYRSAYAQFRSAYAQFIHGTQTNYT